MNIPNYVNKVERLIKVNYTNGNSETYQLTDNILKKLKESDVESFEIIEEKTITTESGEVFSSRNRKGNYFIGQKMTLFEAFKAYGNDPTYINVLAHMKNDKVKYVCLTPYKKLIAISKDDICTDLDTIDEKIDVQNPTVKSLSDKDVELSICSSVICNYGLDEERYFDRNQVEISDILGIKNLNYFSTNDIDVISYNGDFYLSKPKNEEKYFIGKKMSLEEASLLYGMMPSYINVFAYMRRNGVTTVLLTSYNKLIAIPDDAKCIEPSEFVFASEYSKASK